MKIGKSKLMLIGTTIMSLFAVGVAAVSTFAWFQVNTTSGHTPTNTSLITSDTTQLDITNITGYKAEYNQTGINQVDYSTYSITPYSSTPTSNDDKGIKNNLDVPSGGEGYYIVGNSGWVTDRNYKNNTSLDTDATKWQYSSSIKMETSVIKNDSDNLANLAVLESGIYLSANTEIKIRHHYVDTDDVETHDDWINSDIGSIEAFDSSNVSSAVTVTGGNYKIATAAVYKLFLNSSSKLCFYITSFSKPANPNYRIKTNPKNQLQNPSNTGVVYLSIASLTGWANDGAKICADFFVGSNHHWVVMSSSGISNIYEASIPEAFTVTNVIFVRAQSGLSGTSGDGWIGNDNVWNRTGDIAINDVKNKCCKITGWGNGSNNDNRAVYSNVSAISIHYTLNGSTWYRKLACVESNTGSLSFANVTTSSQFCVFVSDSAKLYSNLVNTSKPYCVAKGNNIGVAVGGTYTIGWNGSGVYVNNSAAIIGYGSDTNNATWSYQAITSAVTLAKDQAFKVIYNGTWYGYTKLITDGKTLFNEGTYGGDDQGNNKNIKAIIKGTYTITFNTTNYNIGFTVTSTSFNTLTAAATNSKIYYLKSTVSYWNETANYAMIAYDANGLSKWYPMTAVGGGYTGMYKTEAVDKAHTGVYFVRYGNTNDVYTIWNRTVAATNNGLSDNWYTINSDDSGTPRIYSGTWGTFFNDTGYFLYGDGSFQINSVSYVFGAANEMSTSSLPTDVVAIMMSKTVTVNTKFQAWYFDTNGSGTKYNTKNNDTETNSIITTDGDYLKFTVAGTFDIWLTKFGKIVIKSSATEVKLWIHDIAGSSDDYATANFGTNCKAVYEVGYHITDAMIGSGTGVLVGFVVNYGGNKTQYSAVSGSYDFVSGTGDYGFDSLASQACLKIVKPGLYNFYLIGNSIKIINRPYTTDGSDVKTGDGDYGYYIIPYNSAYHFATSYKNGKKMANSTGNNYATYIRYSVSNATETVFFQHFYNGGSENINNITAGNTSSASKITVTTSGSNQYVTLKTGVYNIYIYNDAEHSRKAVSIVTYDLSDFTTLNSIPSTCSTSTDVSNNYSTIVLDVTFTVKENKAFTVGLKTVFDTTEHAKSNAFSKFARCKLFVDSKQNSTYVSALATNQAKWDYFRSQCFVGNDTEEDQVLKPMASGINMTATLDSSGNVAANAHHAYIVIDYDWSQLSNLSPSYSKLENDFSFVISISA